MRDNSDKKGGLLKGKPHSNGGIKAVVTDDLRPVELEGGEAIVNKRTMKSGKEFEFEGEDKTPCEIISDLNQLDGNGVPIECEKVEPASKDEFKDGGKVPTTPYHINDLGGYDYTGDAKETAKEVDLLSLPRNIDGTNCANCIFVKNGFCANKKIMLPVNDKMCCALWDGLGTERSWDAPKPKLEPVPTEVKEYPLNELGGYDYTGKAKDIAEEYDLITLPKSIKGTNCGNCGFYTPLVKGGFCFRHNIQLPVTTRMSCAYWTNVGIEKSWAIFEEGGSVEPLLAPNGKPSNLTPEQHALVRTPAFKAWFGDWENDPANASKVVDANGEPLVVYHATQSDFNVFGHEYKGSAIDHGTMGSGFYFTSDLENAENYKRNLHTNTGKSGGERLITCFLDIRKPKYVANPFAMTGLEAKKSEAFTQKLINKGHDGIESLFGSFREPIQWFVTFEPTQIKLADGSNTTFDGSNPDIRFGEGGNISKTPAPKKEQISGSDINKEGSAADTKSAKEITFSAKTEKAIENKVDAHNAKNKTKVTVDVAKAVVRRGMGAYSTSHRPTIKGGKPNSRVAWGLARLDAFLYKVKNGKSKSGNYTQDDDLIAELGLPKPKMQMGGTLPLKNTITPTAKFQEGGAITPEDAAREFIKNLSPEDLARMQSAVKEARNEALLESQQRVEALEAEAIALKKERAQLRQQEIDAGGYVPELQKDKLAISLTTDVLELAIAHGKNIVLAYQNGGTVDSIKDKIGNTYGAVPNLSHVDTEQIIFDEATILEAPKPLYLPIIDEKEFARKSYIFDTIRVAEDLYLLAGNGYGTKTFVTQRINLTTRTEQKFSIEEVLGLVLVTLDQLVLISDYYLTKAKAEARQEAKRQTERSERHYDGLPLDRRERHLNQRGFYNTLPADIKKKITQENWEALDLQGKESIYKPFKRYGSKRLSSKIKDNAMPRSFHTMYEVFLNPEAKMNGRYANSEVFAYWRKFAEMMAYKLIDISEARKFESESYQAGLETSFGDSNTDPELYNTYGLLVKRQSGDKIAPFEIDQIKDAWVKINGTFGKLIRQAKEFGLKISHAGLKHIFARKWIGIYWPRFKVIGVSNIYGEKPFAHVFAHEVAHWIDNLLGSQSGKRYLCDDYESLAGQIASVFRKNMNKKSTSDYYNSTKECFARALQQHFAMVTDGDNASMVTPVEGEVEEMPYITNDVFVSKDAYYDKVKPLIEAFFEKYRDFFVYDTEIVEDEPAVIKPSAEIETPEEAVAEAKKEQVDLPKKQVTSNEGYGQVINSLFSGWNNIKNEKQQSLWEVKVRETKFGTYGTKSIFEVLENFPLTGINEVTRLSFLRDLEGALNIPFDERKYNNKVDLDLEQLQKQTQLALAMDIELALIELELELE